MDIIAQLTETDIPKIIEPTIAALLPVLETKRSQIRQVPRKTFTYGPKPRHQLDVYYPTAKGTIGKTPVLVWVYGGGFNTGDREMAPPLDLAYSCVGAYFARQGFITVIPDYRLVPEGIFPDAAEDVRDAIIWTINHAEELTTPSTPNPDLNNVFLMGHSAGATHAFTALILPETPASAAVRPSVAGAILCAGGYHFLPLSQSNNLRDVVIQHWGGEDRVKENDPMGLLAKADDNTVASLPEILSVEGEREPPWLQVVGDDFRSALEARGKKRPEFIVAKGHNHVSLNFTLGTGEGEGWAEETVAWMKGKVQNL